MAHFAARADLGLAIKVQDRLRLLRQAQPISGILPDEIDHLALRMRRRVAQRPSGDRAHMLFKLVTGARIHGPMPRIVNARRNFIDQQGIAGQHKELHSNHTDIIQTREDCLRNLQRFHAQARFMDGGGDAAP